MKIFVNVEFVATPPSLLHAGVAVSVPLPVTVTVTTRGAISLAHSEAVGYPVSATLK